jgi:hypothetical protein
MAGLYEVSLLSMERSKVKPRLLPRALGELTDANLAYYESNVLWVRSRVKRLNSKHTRIARAIAKDVELIHPEHPLRRAFLLRYGDVSWLRESLSTLVPDDLDLAENSVGPQLSLGSLFGSTSGITRGSGEPHLRLQGQGLTSRPDKGVVDSSVGITENGRLGPSGRAGELALQVLSTSNEISGQRLTSAEWLRMIERRISEHPEVDLDGHRQAILAVYGEDWWRGSKGGHWSPELVYRRGDLFEKALMAATMAAQLPESGSKADSDMESLERMKGRRR